MTMEQLRDDEQECRDRARAELAEREDSESWGPTGQSDPAGGKFSRTVSEDYLRGMAEGAEDDDTCEEC